MRVFVLMASIDHGRSIHVTDSADFGLHHRTTYEAEV
jgi:hypothetical protein